MANVSILPELDVAEDCVTSLCEAIQRKTHSLELRQEYHTLCNQATNALNKIRAIAEMDDWFTSGGPNRAFRSIDEEAADR